MNVAQLTDHVAAAAGLEKGQARKAIDATFAAITKAASTGEDTALAGFGQFKVKDSPAREGRNPSTGQVIKIAASKKLAFTAAKTLKDALNTK